MKKTINIIFIIIFILLCIAPFIGLIAGYENANVEKKAVVSMPNIISNGKLNMDFTKEFDDYFTQNFAFRNDLITLYARLNNALFDESVSEKVIVGKDGWLFFEPTLEDYQRNNALADNEIYRIYKTLEIQRAYLASQGIDFIFTVAPNKSSIYGQHMPNRYLVTDSKSNAEKLFELLEEKDFSYVNLFDILNQEEEQTYHKLDTHWNNFGALLAYHEIMNSIYSPYSSFYWERYFDTPYEIERTWTGDLSQMLYPSAVMYDLQYNYNIEKSYTSARPIRSMEDMNIQTASDYGIDNIYMFRDSFANALIPIISNAFAQATYSRATPYDYRNISAENTDIVIVEIVERNIANLIEQSPIMPAIEIKFEDEIELGNYELHIRETEQDNYTKISGCVVLDEYYKDKNYDIFVQVVSPQKTTVYIPFPIAEKEYESFMPPYANTSFSIILTSDQFNIETDRYNIIIFDGEKYLQITN